MNKEIKEILFLLHNDRLTESGKRKLADYITNLQEENKESEEAVKYWQNQCDLRQRAIEYITSEKSIEVFKTIESREEWLKVNRNLLNILQGEDKEDE